MLAFLDSLRCLAAVVADLLQAAQNRPEPARSIATNPVATLLVVRAQHLTHRGTSATSGDVGRVVSRSDHCDAVPENAPSRGRSHTQDTGGFS